MKILPLALAIALFVSGCVLVGHDDKIAQLQPAKVTLEDFAGLYRDSASYATPQNESGVMGHPTLGSAIRGYEFGSDVQVSIDAGAIVVQAIKDKSPNSTPVRYLPEKDFTFVEHRVVFKDSRWQSGAGSGGMGSFKTSMQWMLDDAGRLVVISGSKGGGLLLVLPMVTAGSTLSIFDRAAKKG